MKTQKVFLILLAVIFITVNSALALEPLKGHSIKVDKSDNDWIGKVPEQENTAVISEGEYIWKDAKGDDTGNGKYNYAPNKAIAKGADLKEFRVTYDKKNVYFLIKCARPGDWWAPYRIIGIHKEGEQKGMTVLAQGDVDELDPETGCFGEIKVDESLACQYVIGISSTWKAWIWDTQGKLVAIASGDKKFDTPGFLVADDNWSSLEVQVPIEIIGNPVGKTWKFIVGIGQQDNDHFREIYEEATEWHAGGGEGNEGEDGSDPDVFDLASPSMEIQEKELGSYNENGRPNDPDAFATIKESFVTVIFAK